MKRAIRLGGLVGLAIFFGALTALLTSGDNVSKPVVVFESTQK